VVVDVEVDRASMKMQTQTVNYVHFFIEAASIKFLTVKGS